MPRQLSKSPFRPLGAQLRKQSLLFAALLRLLAFFGPAALLLLRQGPQVDLTCQGFYVIHM